MSHIKSSVNPFFLQARTLFFFIVYVKCVCVF